MILPKKHISLPESYLGFGAFLLTLLGKGESIDSLWQTYKLALNNSEYPINFSFDEFIITVDFLFIVGAIYIKDGRIYCEAN